MRKFFKNLKILFNMLNIFRVIFMEVNSDICRERLLNRRYNIVTGSKHNLSSTIVSNDLKLGVHPKDFRLNVERDVKYMNQI